MCTYSNYNNSYFLTKHEAASRTFIGYIIALKFNKGTCVKLGNHYIAGRRFCNGCNRRRRVRVDLQANETRRRSSPRALLPPPPPARRTQLQRVKSSKRT
ncbi:hypothetical protein B5X24_HaOG216837 [Helicoverpa armigera]|nr:hypothetical protein B5X24_HaOG216837 [Helicoverpa armigera]